MIRHCGLASRCETLRKGLITGQRQELNNRWFIDSVEDLSGSSTPPADGARDKLARSMVFDDLLKVYGEKFANQGRFRLRPGEDLRSCIAGNRIPNLPSVYLIYGVRKGTRELLYIGKSGTVRTDGSLKNQGLAVRLRMKQNKTLWRAQYYEEQMEYRKLDALEFEWYVTFDGSVKVLPMKAEADLLHAYFNDHGRLPPENRAA